MRIVWMTIILVVIPLFVGACGGGGGGVAAEPVTASNFVTDEESPAADSETKEDATQQAEDSGETSQATEDEIVVVQAPEETDTEGDSVAAEDTPDEPPAAFMLAVLPDSQHLTVDYPYIFDAQLQWIADHREDRNIAFVLHEGDVTHYNNESGWINASISYEIIDGIVPHAIAVGNHDMEFPITFDTTLFNQYFPVSLYSGYESFGGSYPEGTLDNSYHYFTAGGVDWLVMSIRYLPSDDILDWADSVAEAYPDRTVIVVTHSFVDEVNEIARDAETLWEDLISGHKNISLVFNGHHTDGQYGRIELEGDNGNTVYGIFANYQKSYQGGLGYMRLVTIDIAAETISINTYSPYLDESKTDAGNEFVIEGYVPPAM